MLHRQLKFYQLNVVSTANHINLFRAHYLQIQNNFTEHQVMSVYHRAPLRCMRLRPNHSKTMIAIRNIQIIIAAQATRIKRAKPG